MQERTLRITENRPLTRAVFRMTLEGEGLELHRPGQFVNVQVPGLYLRRPLSVHDQEGNALRIIYKTVGRGTEALSRMAPGESLNVLTGLGNGYELARAGAFPLLLGGGVGIPPLYLLARRLRERGLPVTAVLGFNTRGEIFAREGFEALGCETVVTTADGSEGVKGFVTDALPERYSFFYACGPLPMLRAVCGRTGTSGQVSLEERMGCGFGACVGCTCRTAAGPKRVCRDGPVFEKEEVLWED